MKKQIKKDLKRLEIKMSKDNLQLPKTAFSMKASLPTKEPLIQEKWEKNDVYEKIRKLSKGKSLFYMTDLLMPMAIYIWELH